MIPGIVDIHAHMDREGLKTIYPSLEGLRSIGEIKERIRGLAADKAPGEWVVTMPIGDPPNYADMPQSLAEGRFPNRHDLDEAAPDNPVYIKGIWTPWNVPPAVSIANSAALALAGINRHTASPDSSVTIEVGSDGEPTGVFVDTGRYPSVEFTLMREAPRFTAQQRLDALKESMLLYNSVGTTGTYEGHGVAPETLQAYKAAWDAGEMTVRANLTVSPHWQSVADAAREMGVVGALLFRPGVWRRVPAGERLFHSVRWQSLYRRGAVVVAALYRLGGLHPELPFARVLCRGGDAGGTEQHQGEYAGEGTAGRGIAGF